ncbi:MAG TPA: four-carbon acid sugar kinase family protein, partial [Acidobacteriaceae bacterium]
MRQLLIIADDLSGAADCANACMSAGLRAVVTFDESENALQSDVLSVDCDTRHLEPRQAAARVTEVMRSYVANHPDLLLIKKIDSSLR